MKHGTWNMEHEAWNMEHGTWNMEHGTWNMEQILSFEFGVRIFHPDPTPTPQFSPHCPTGGVKMSPLGRGAVLAMMFK
jgi:hypothetical protein